MKFSNVRELLEYIKNNTNYTSDDDISHLEFNITESEAVMESLVEEPEQLLEVAFETFYDNKSMVFKKGSENLLVVESVDSIPNTCGTAKVVLAGRVLMTNVCEMDGIPTAKFDVSVDSKRMTNVTFKLTTDKNSTNTICL